MSDETDVSICNYSLSLLGLDPIEAFDEGSPAAEVCGRIYPKKRDAVLAGFNWRPNARKRLLNRLADETPLNEWKYVHAFPSNMIEGPTAVFGDDASSPSDQWDIYEGKLFSNFEKVIIDFLGRPDESEFPPLLVDFLGHVVAAAACLPLTESPDRADYLNRLAYGPPGMGGNGGLYAEAKRAVAQNKPMKTLFQNGDPLTGSRF